MSINVVVVCCAEGTLLYYLPAGLCHFSILVVKMQIEKGPGGI